MLKRGGNQVRVEGDGRSLPMKFVNIFMGMISRKIL